jgi:hypothetical protein
VLSAKRRRGSNASSGERRLAKRFGRKGVKRAPDHWKKLASSWRAPVRRDLADAMRTFRTWTQTGHLGLTLDTGVAGTRLLNPEEKRQVTRSV